MSNEGWIIRGDEGWQGNPRAWRRTELDLSHVILPTFVELLHHDIWSIATSIMGREKYGATFEDYVPAYRELWKRALPGGGGIEAMQNDRLRVDFVYGPIDTVSYSWQMVAADPASLAESRGILELFGNVEDDSLDDEYNHMRWTYVFIIGATQARTDRLHLWLKEADNTTFSMADRLLPILSSTFGSEVLPALPQKQDSPLLPDIWMAQGKPVRQSVIQELLKSGTIDIQPNEGAATLLNWAAEYRRVYGQRTLSKAKIETIA